MGLQKLAEGKFKQWNMNVMITLYGNNKLSKSEIKKYNTMIRKLINKTQKSAQWRIIEKRSSPTRSPNKTTKITQTIQTGNKYNTLMNLINEKTNTPSLENI